jgi:hypothetical protein
MGHRQSKAIAPELPGSDIDVWAPILIARQPQISPCVWQGKRRPIHNLLVPVQLCHRRLGRCRVFGQQADLHHRQQSGRRPFDLNISAIGGTHEAWQAASNRLISLRNQVYDDFQSSSYSCLTVTYFHPSLSSSLAAVERQTPKYQHLSRTVPECPPIAANRGGYCAA